MPKFSHDEIKGRRHVGGEGECPLYLRSVAKTEGTGEQSANQNAYAIIQTGQSPTLMMHAKIPRT